MCDFWARVRLRKLHINELVQELSQSISNCEDDVGSSLDDLFSQFWTDFGLRDIKRFCEEDPDLCSKMKQVEERIRMLLF